MLSDASSTEQQLLSALAYQANEVVLHTDTRLLPKRKAAWAAWNYWLKGEANQETRLPSLTYNMNILQHIEAPETFCVTLNSSEDIDPSKILRRFTYHHPVFSRPAIEAQQKKRRSAVSTILGFVAHTGITAFMRMGYAVRWMW